MAGCWSLAVSACMNARLGYNPQPDLSTVIQR